MSNDITALFFFKTPYNPITVFYTEYVTKGFHGLTLNGYLLS